MQGICLVLPLFSLLTDMGSIDSIEEYLLCLRVNDGWLDESSKFDVFDFGK